MTEMKPLSFPDVTFGEFWERRVDRGPDTEFLVYEDRTYTLRELDESANRVAHGLLEAGVGSGDRIALLLPSDLRLLQIELAIQKVGAVMVPLIYGSTAPEVAYVVEHSEPTACITDSLSFGVACADGIPGSPDTTWFLFDSAGADATTDRVRSGDALYSDSVVRPPRHGIAPDDPMAIMYTSGSTGKPKGVVQPSRGIVAAGYAIAERLNATADDNFFACLPLFHAAATHMLLAPAIACGGRFTLVPTFSRDRFWEQVRSSGSTVTLLMPAQLAILLTAEPSERDHDHPMRAFFSHVQPQAFIDRFGVPVSVAWAMTETSGVGTLSDPGLSVPEHCIGKPMADADVKVIGANNEALSPGEQGELCFRHPGIMLEYFRDPENTAATRSDGWVHTGDLCSMDAEGAVYFHGRIKNVIKRAGENIAGEEVEFCIADLPGVVDCVTAAVPDEIYTEEVHAVVGIEPGSGVNEKSVVDWCAERLSSWKVPRYITIVEGELPRLTNGKLNRLQVKREHAADAAYDTGLRARSKSAQR